MTQAIHYFHAFALFAVQATVFVLMGYWFGKRSNRKDIENW